MRCPRSSCAEAGASTVGRAQLAVVVLSYRNERTIVAAVESLFGQVGPPLELVVSHSGGGPTPGLLGERFPGLRLLASPSRRTPGAARNAGVEATHAPYVAFLAGDCAACPGWAMGRLRRHRAGAVAVASAMATPSAAAPLASHLLQHGYRMRHVDAPGHLRFGVSYARELLVRHGPFPEGLPGEEDVALNLRLLESRVQVVFAPDVVTEHSYPATATELLRDQYHRGRLRYRVRAELRPRAALAARALADAPAGLWRAAGRGSLVRPRGLARSVPLVVAGSLATAAGIVTEPGPRPGPSPGPGSARARVRLHSASSRT